MKVTVCGGGNLGHVVSAVLGSNENVSLSLLSGKAELWAEKISVEDPFGKIYECRFEKVSASPKEVILGADIVLLCLPGFAIQGELEAIRPYLAGDTAVGSIVSSTGFFFEAAKLLPQSQTVFGFQRVPYISRTVVYGKSAKLLGYKDSLNLAVENCKDKEALRKLVEELFLTRTYLLESHYEASLSNSNPLLHPARLYTMWKDWDGSARESNPYFYREWTDEASQLLIKMDGEFQKLLERLPVRKGSIPSILSYYQSSDAEALTLKIRSIPAFRDIKSPMKEVAGAFVPDFESRYFKEDFPYGMRFIVECADERGVEIPEIKKVYAWGITKCL